MNRKIVLALAVGTVLFSMPPEQVLGFTKSPDEDAGLQRNAVQASFTLLEKHGDVTVLTSPDASWEPAKTGEAYAVGTRIRTGPGSRARIRLEDDSFLHLFENSEVHVAELPRSPENASRRARVALLFGEMTARIAPMDDPSAFHIDAAGAILSTRGAHVLVSADKARTVRLSVFEGAAEIMAAGARTQVPANAGVIARDHRRPSPRIALPGTPVLSSPAPGLTTAVQRIAFSWAPGPSPTTAQAYRVEIARDPHFVEIVQTGTVSQTAWTSGVLAPGTYVWRAFAIDRNGLAGPASEWGTFTVVRDLRVGIRLSRPALEKEGKMIVSPHHEFIPYPLSDDTSVVGYETRIGDQDYRPYQGGVCIRREGARTIAIRGVGADGALGEEAAMTVWVDACPPATYVKVGNSRPCGIGTYVFDVELIAEDESGVEAIEYSINDKPFEAYTKPFELNTVRQNKLRFRARDRLGNVTDERILIFPPSLVTRR